jgi:hypothetical protein
MIAKVLLPVRQARLAFECDGLAAHHALKSEMFSSPLNGDRKVRAIQARFLLRPGKAVNEIIEA